MAERDSGTTSQPGGGCLGGVLLVLLLFQITSALRVLQQMIFLPEAVQPLLAIRILLIGALGTLLMSALYKLARGRENAVRYGGWMLVLFVTSQGLFAVLFAQADYHRQRLPFLLIAVSSFLVVSLMILLRSRRSLANK